MIIYKLCLILSCPICNLLKETSLFFKENIALFAKKKSSLPNIVGKYIMKKVQYDVSFKLSYTFKITVQTFSGVGDS